WLGGCDRVSGAPPASTTTAATPVHAGDPSATSDACPSQVPGTTVTAADIEGGAALTFTSTGDVADLRRRVRRMAEMHNLYHGAGGVMMAGDSAPPHWGGASPDHEGGMMDRGRMVGGMMGRGWRLPAATASVEDLDGGARLIYRTANPSDIEALRDHARTRAGRMVNGACPAISSDSGQATSPAGEHQER
ncbi:MAG: hypothetical protein ABJE95_33255, partial [Byssovorax sp.]